MRALNLIFPAALLCICSFCRTEMFYWNDRVRPPVSLREALDISENLLGDDAKNRFCVRVQIYGNPMGAPKPGAWNLYFAAADGSKKHVYIDMDGNATLSHWNEAIDWKKDAGRRKDLLDAKSRLEDLFQKEGLDVKLDMRNGRLEGRFKTRVYGIYKPDKNGAFAEILVDDVGPCHNGFTFDAEIVDEDTYFDDFEFGPYWFESADAYPTTSEGKVILVRKKYGKDFPKEINNQIDQAFGLDVIGTRY